MKFDNTGRLSPGAFVDRLLEGLARSPQGQVIIAEHNASVRDERKTLWAQHQTLSREFIKRRDAAIESNTAAQAAAAKARDAHEAAQAKAIQAQALVFEHIDQFSRDVKPIEAELVRTADPAIDDLLGWLTSELEKTPTLIHLWPTDERWSNGNVVMANNQVAVDKHAQLILAQQDTAKKLKASYSDDLPTALAAIKKAVEVSASACLTNR